MSDGVIISCCGVCCNHCGMQSRIPEMAKELKRFVNAYGYGEWISTITQEFDFSNLMKGLEWFVQSGCPGCLEGGGMPQCDVRICCLKRKLKNCYFCEDFSRCEKLGYQKETYQIGEHYGRIRQIGYENWLKEQGNKIRENYDNIEHLERRRNK